MSWAEFREQISASLDNEELRTLCFDLDVDYDSLRGQGKDDKIRELIALLRRNGRLPELESRLSVLRPLTNWQGILDQIPNHDLLPPSDFVPPGDRSKRDKKRNVLIAVTVVLGLIIVLLIFFLVYSSI